MIVQSHLHDSYTSMILQVSASASSKVKPKRGTLEEDSPTGRFIGMLVTMNRLPGGLRCCRYC